MSDVKIYWSGDVGYKSSTGLRDDFGYLITNSFVDGKTIHGPWGIMASGQSFAINGCGRLGTGYGQRYEKQKDGRWMKVEG